MKPVIIAHRGASALAMHENSLEAFQIAIDIKADYAEFDIRKTSDNKLIVFHDNSYKGHQISSLTYEELCSLTSEKGLRPPLLYEVIALCKGKIKLDIELKESGFEKDVVDIVKKDFDYDEFMIKSFIDQVVLNIKDIDSSIKAGLLVGKGKVSFITRLTEYYPKKRLNACRADFISPHYKFVTKSFVKRMKALKKDIYLWTVNKTELIDKYMKKSITGIITDRPDIALKSREYLQ